MDEYLTGREAVEMVGRLYNLSAQVARQRAAEVLERISLAADADRLVRTYSGGMKRRLDLAASLVGRPDVLFLDEPTTGIDPRSRVDVWALIRDLVSSGTTVLLTTQYLDEADRLADRIGVIHEGRLISEGTGNELKDRLGGAVIQVEVPEAAQAATRAALGADDGTDGTITLPAPAGIDPTVVIVRRNLLRILRLPQLLVFATVQPVMFLILFNYVFGGSVGRAIPAAAGGKYINWLVIDRFRSLPMARSAVLAGRTVADLLRNGFVIGLMIVLGFSPGLSAADVVRVAGRRRAGGDGVRLRAVVGDGVPGSCRQELRGCPDRVVPAGVPAGVRKLRVRADQHAAGLAARVCRHQPVTRTANAVRGLVLGEGALAAGQTVAGEVTGALLWALGIIVVFAPLAVRPLPTRGQLAFCHLMVEWLLSASCMFRAWRPRPSRLSSMPTKC